MYIDKFEKIQYAAYEKYINIELFNDIISFVVNTTCIEKDMWNLFREMEKKCIWINKKDSKVIQEKYKFQYFGELLERYEERIGNDIKDIRAIALALGYAKNFIEKSMIVGTQLIDFITKIKKIAEDDIYLKGALYLYDNKKYYIYSEELMNKNYTNTEEIIFVLSIFYERIEDFFNKNKKQIIDLIGKNRNISVYGNIGMYAWFIRNLYPLICENRKKDVSFLKALIKVPTGFQKEDTMVYKELISNGYNKNEIAYLNYLILYYDTVPKKVGLGGSIVEEKIAINLCITLINNKNSYDSHIYDLIRKILNRYSHFDIKCYGFSKIIDAIKDKINIINPTTFAELCSELDYNLYSFDILDKKWDIVAFIADSKKYERIFDCFILYGKYNKSNKEILKQCIKKYNELTNREYIKSFLEYDYNRGNIFDFLVENGVILLKDVFEYILQEGKHINRNHLREYIKGVRNKKSFQFLKYLLRLNKYNITEISNFGFCFENLINGYGYSRNASYYLDIKRNFLNVKGCRILFNCVEKYVFYNIPIIYFGFLEATLQNDIICKLVPKNELRELYLSLCEIYPQKYNKEWLQEKFLTSEEMNTIREKKRIENELKEKEEFITQEKLAKERFDAVFEKNSFIKLYKFCQENTYNEKRLKSCIKLTKKYILENIHLFRKDKQEILGFMELFGFYIENNELSIDEFTEITYEYIKKEEQENEYINAAC